MALPPHPSGRLAAGVCVFGLTHACGLTWADTPKAASQPLTARRFIDLAVDCGLSWAELPARMLGELDADSLRSLREYAEERQVGLVLAGGQVPAGGLMEELRAAHALGAPTLRCILSGVLCGDRRNVPGGWSEHLRKCASELEKLVPEAERLQVAIAIENHQDADSADLLRLCRQFESRYLGVTLDCGNPLSVMEEPVEFATRLAPYLRHVHLKDYRVHAAPNGFRLVRCALGEGVVDFPALFRLFDAQEWPITRVVEAGALQARLIPMLEPSWWAEFGPRHARDILAALSAVWNGLRPDDEEWRTPFERELSGEELAAYEWEQHHASVAYLRRLDASGS